jgi:beta-glucosidase
MMRFFRMPFFIGVLIGILLGCSNGGGRESPPPADQPNSAESSECTVPGTGSEQIEIEARKLLAQMTFSEKIDQMTGDARILSEDTVGIITDYNNVAITTSDNERLNIPGIRFTDGPRGVVMGSSTCFPVSMARGATWDPELETRVGDVMGVEARSQGANFFGGVCINVLRHPAWGRAQETFGEDPFLLGEMGAASVRGIQRHVMACIKHYALNSMENARFNVDVSVDERTLREVYLPHFKRCVDEGAAAVMSAYNKVNGSYCGQNSHLLRDILKTEWGFEGLVMSDFFFGIHSTEGAILGGLDVEMPYRMHFYFGLPVLIRDKVIPLSLIDDAVLRVLRQKVRFSRIGQPWLYDQAAIASPAHCALTREVARKAIVLLKNDAIDGAGTLLPLHAGVKRILVVGKLAKASNIGDMRSSGVEPPYVVTPLEGLTEAMKGRSEVIYDAGTCPAAVASKAAAADAVIVVAGYDNGDEGEYIYVVGGDRDILTLHKSDESMIRTVAAANPRTVVVLIGGGPIITEAWCDNVPAILMAWYPGMEGGSALADILLGRVNPSAKLPCVFPRSPDDLPFYDKNARAIVYDADFGYRLMDKKGYTPAFAFGFGLSYTTYAYSNLRLENDEINKDGTLRVKVDITNTGSLAGEEIAQLYIGAQGSKVERAVKELKGFTKVRLAPGEEKTATFEVPAKNLAYYDENLPGWVVEPANYKVYVGPSSRPEDLLVIQFRIKG